MIRISAIFLLTFLTLRGLLNAEPTVLVSIAPYKTFVQEVAGDTVNVNVVVPAGADSHSFEPTSKQMIAMSQAKIWFRIGEGFEKRLIEVVQTYNPDIKIIDLRDPVAMICQAHTHHHADGHHQCSEDFRDVHVWLSPREVKKQIKLIATTLEKQFPEHAKLYSANAHAYIQRLEALDAELTDTLAPIKGTTFLVSHPAYAYFARDYGLHQLSVEFEGRDPTPRQLTQLFNQARQLKICKVFIQPQHSNKGAILVAKHIGAETISIDPYSEQYFHSMRALANHFQCGQRRD